jgi:hypothetical protein
MSMELAYMINQMCHTVLPSADISAIRKARGFSAKEATSRGTFENFYLSSIGLDAVLASLLPDEVAALHLLLYLKEEVDITFFERLYGSAKKGEGPYYGTFTQRYKDILDAVKKSLVRKGILVIAEAKTRGETTQMERWRFRFPPQFAEFLPPIISSPYTSNERGEIKTDVVRAKLREAAVGPQVAALPDRQQLALKVEDGSLKIGECDFQASDLAAWQQTAWLAALSAKVPNDPTSLSPVKAVQTILANLDPRAWVAPEQLEPALRVFCFGAKMPNAVKICQEGWKWGCLARLFEDQNSYYRLPSPSETVPATASDPSTYLELHPAGSSVLVDLRLIPLETLEALNRLARLEALKDRLAASPDPIKMGRAAPEDRRSPLADWLSAHSPEFQQVIEAVNLQWGKTILHSGLLVARVRDLSLRVQLERDLGEYLLVLSDEYVAFPRGWGGEVEKTLKKGGFVIKKVRA